MTGSASRPPIVAVDYTRLSKNRGGLSDNCAIQHRECVEFIEDNGWKHADTFEDDDRSASKYTKKPRPRYEQLVLAVKKNLVELIVCTELSRLYRRLEELLDLIKLAETTKLRGIWTTDGISYDLSTPEGIHAAIAAINNAVLESAKISKRQKRKKRARAVEGRPSGGGRPYGYEQDGITIRESEAQILRDCLSSVIAGVSQSSLVRELNERGVPSRAGKQWTVGNFKRLITKKRYVGIREHMGAEYPAVWPPLFSDDDYALMMARFKESEQPWGHGLIKGRKYMLSGLLACGSCGAAMYGSGRELAGGAYQRRYRCKPYNNQGIKVGCGRVFRGADPLDAFITEVVLMRFDSPEVMRALTPEDNGRATELTQKLTGHRMRAKQLAREYSLGEHAKADYTVMRDTLHEAMDAAQTELATIQASRIADALPRHDLIREVWEEASLEWRRSVINLVVDKISVHPQSPGTKLWGKGRWKFDVNAIEVSWTV